MSNSLPSIDAGVQLRTQPSEGEMTLSTAAESVAMPLQPAAGGGSDGPVESVFNLIIDAAAGAAADENANATLPQPPGAKSGTSNMPPTFSGANSALALSVQLDPSEKTPLPPRLLQLSPPQEELGAAQPRAPVAALNPLTTTPPVSAQAQASARSNEAPPGEALPVKTPLEQSGVDAVVERTTTRLDAPAAKGADATAGAVASLASAMPGQVMQLAMPALAAEPLQINREEGPLLPHRDRNHQQDDADFYDDIEEELLPSPDDPADDLDAQRPEPEKVQSDHLGLALQAVPPSDPTLSESGLFEQLCKALEQRGVQGDGDAATFVQQVFDELNRRRRVVLVSPDRVVKGLRVPAYVDVLCPATPRGLAVRLSGELIWIDESDNKPWELAHVFKSQSATEGREFLHVDGSGCTHSVAVCLALQNLPANACPQVCVRVIDANRLWQMLSNQWSLRVVISPEPLSLHRYSL